MEEMLALFKQANQAVQISGKRERSNYEKGQLNGGDIGIIQASKSSNEESAKVEAKRNMQDSGRGYSNTEVVVNLRGWDPNYSKAVAQAVLSALKRLILADKDLPDIGIIQASKSSSKLSHRLIYFNIKQMAWSSFPSLQSSSQKVLKASEALHGESNNIAFLEHLLKDLQQNGRPRAAEGSGAKSTLLTDDKA
ncbi:hypothetical protein RND71_012586 [Anisodus tanguticus]|uniref:Uncharacterized protein n=1 Tax=Anisodus tanguticus TaxID=243964 RepID=A0AAE1SFX8_9SOLA|nr:hypothetical protein RND71_012586 [Anisodus tanguticus]